MNTQASELGADHTVKWRRAYSWLTSLTLWLGTWRWGNLTSSQRTGRWDSETSCFWQRTHCLSQQKDSPKLSSTLFAWVSSKQPQPAFGVCFLPKRHSHCGLRLLASVLDGLQSQKWNPSSFPSRDVLGPCHVLEGCFSTIHSTTSCFSLHTKSLEVWHNWARTRFCPLPLAVWTWVSYWSALSLCPLICEWGCKD